MNVKALLSANLTLTHNTGVSIKNTYVTFMKLPDAGCPGVIDFFKNGERHDTILFRFSEDKQSLVAWSAASEETLDQQFTIVSVEGGIEIIWTTNCRIRSRFVKLAPTIAVNVKCCTAMQTPRTSRRKNPIEYFKKVLLPKKSNTRKIKFAGQQK